ncbi:putative serine/threonine protein kinase [Blattamonas nauphoetae]|uniref:Serine/threonine protein kinase n=1 Tax=Blattamonas nauphoetae TaxID=2049346 RepID=A0ABQ9XFV3_9EUKA|nr:putative serine/threonine protein kinase [Blattamonas nauphoetae]
MENYKTQEQIGEGLHSKCYLGRQKKSIQYYCMKEIDNSQRDLVSAEVQIWHTLEHPNIVKFIEWYGTTNHIWVVSELCAGGDLANLLSQDKKLNETSIRAFTSDIRAALLFLHQNGIVYGDLHPSTILFDGAGTMKLCDFKYSSRIDRVRPDLPESRLTFRHLEYLAPELIRSHGITLTGFGEEYNNPKFAYPFSYQSDLWALGCLMYEMVEGHPPFAGTDTKSLSRSILFSEPTLNPAWSPDFTDLISGLLCKSPLHRMSWPELNYHPFWRHCLYVFPLQPQLFTDALMNITRDRELKMNNGEIGASALGTEDDYYAVQQLGVDSRFFFGSDAPKSDIGIPLVDLDIQPIPSLPEAPQLDNIVWNTPTDLVATPIFSISDIEPIKTNFANVGFYFNPLTSEQLRNPSNTTIDTHLSEVLPYLRNCITNVMRDNNPQTQGQFSNVLNYISYISRNEEVSTLILRSKFGTVLFGLLKDPPIPQIVLQLSIVFATLLRYTKRVSSTLATSGLVTTLAAGIESNDELPSRYATAALGELLYYIPREKSVKSKTPVGSGGEEQPPQEKSEPELIPIDPKWQFNESVVKTMIGALWSESLGKAQYAAKAIGNLAILHNSALSHEFCTTECVDALLDLATRAEGTLQQIVMTTVVTISRLKPEVMTHLCSKVDFTILIKRLVNDPCPQTNLCVMLNLVVIGLKSSTESALHAVQEATSSGLMHKLLDRILEMNKTVLTSKMSLIGAALKRSAPESDAGAFRILNSLSHPDVLSILTPYDKNCLSCYLSSLSNSFSTLFSSFTTFFQLPQEILEGPHISQTDINKNSDDCEDTLKQFDSLIQIQPFSYYLLTDDSLSSLSSLLHTVALGKTRKEEETDKGDFVIPTETNHFFMDGHGDDVLAEMLSPTQLKTFSKIGQQLIAHILNNHTFLLNSLGIVNQTIIPLLYSFPADKQNNTHATTALLVQFASLLQEFNKPPHRETLTRQANVWEEVSESFSGYFLPNLQFFFEPEHQHTLPFLFIAATLLEAHPPLCSTLCVTPLLNHLVAPSTHQHIAQIQARIVSLFIRSPDTNKQLIPWKEIGIWIHTDLTQIEEGKENNVDLSFVQVLFDSLELLALSLDKKNDTLFNLLRHNLVCVMRRITSLLLLLQQSLPSPTGPVSQQTITIATCVHHVFKFFIITSRRMAGTACQPTTFVLLADCLDKLAVNWKTKKTDEGLEALVWVLKILILTQRPFFSADGRGTDCTLNLAMATEKLAFEKTLETLESEDEVNTLTKAAHQSLKTPVETPRSVSSK